MRSRPFGRGALLAAVSLLAIPLAALSAPVVSNVVLVQEPNGSGGTRAVITYDLVSPNGPCDIALALSKNGGADGFPFSVTTVTGALSSVATGTGHTIIWDIAADYPSEEIPSAIVRVAADDGCPILRITYTTP